VIVLGGGNTGDCCRTARRSRPGRNVIVLPLEEMKASPWGRKGRHHEDIPSLTFNGACRVRPPNGKLTAVTSEG